MRGAPVLSRYNYLRDGAEIYRRSFATIRTEADLARFARDEEQVAVRMIHACGMVEIAGDLVFSNGAVAQARRALWQGAPILCDSKCLHVASSRHGCRTQTRSSARSRSRRPIARAKARNDAQRCALELGAIDSMARSSPSAMRQPLCFIFSTCSMKPPRGLLASLECRSALSRGGIKRRAHRRRPRVFIAIKGRKGAAPWPRLP